MIQSIPSQDYIVKARRLRSMIAAFTAVSHCTEGSAFTAL